MIKKSSFSKEQVQQIENDIYFLEIDATTRVYFSKNWRSGDPSRRQDLQNFIDQQTLVFLNQAAQLQHGSLKTDLQSGVLNRNSVFFSLSHSLNFGGVAMSLNPIGFDLEQTERMSDKILRRVCAPLEFQKFQTLALKQKLPLCFHWCAKESAWKALKGPTQPSVISDLEISWSESLSGEFSVQSLRGSNHVQILGNAIEFHEITLAWAVLLPSRF